MSTTDATTRGSVLQIRARIKPESRDDLEAAIARMFSAIEREQLEGIRYTAARMPDGETYVAMLELEDADTNPLPGVPEFGEFQAGLKDWAAAPPEPAPLTVIASYRSF